MNKGGWPMIQAALEESLSVDDSPVHVETARKLALVLDDPETPPYVLARLAPTFVALVEELEERRPRPPSKLDELRVQVAVHRAEYGLPATRMPSTKARRGTTFGIGTSAPRSFPAEPERRVKISRAMIVSSTLSRLRAGRTDFVALPALDPGFPRVTSQSA